MTIIICYIEDKLPFSLSMTPLAKYVKKTITLELPGDLTVFTVDWLAIYDITADRALGSIIIPEELNVPPSLVEVIVSTSTTYCVGRGLHNCVSAHHLEFFKASTILSLT